MADCVLIREVASHLAWLSSTNEKSNDKMHVATSCEDGDAGSSAERVDFGGSSHADRLAGQRPLIGRLSENTRCNTSYTTQPTSNITALFVF